MSDLVVRALTENDTHLFDTLDARLAPGLVGRSLLGHRWLPRHLGGEYRPDWTWVALRGGTVVARAAWWGGPEDDRPVALDWFDFADGEADAAAELLRRAPLYAEYDLVLPPGWRARADVRAAGEARIAAATAAGMRPLVERYRYEWTPAAGLPERPGRLVFRPEPDDEVILDLLRRIGEGSLDAHTRRATEEHGPLAAAREELDFLRWLPSPRDWWQCAFTAEGRPVGLHIPAHNPGGPCIGFIGVLPERRGRGYAYELLVECTRKLVAEGAERIVAATDKDNRPMAAAFARAGYPIAQERVNLV
ncbi:GNAT family N-acetyltransferase [Streptomyces sp. URMC 123]|uniref:GNAT family N-acetyltransferase n=1 Tax=Streptomyces sp. URMC 123 TaxID=3423403 RepID=UPI003F193C28